MKTPKVEADADAEVMLWEVRILDEYSRSSGFTTTLNNYVRIKIFTERGRTENATVDVPFGTIKDLGAETAIKDLAARTIKPDGTILDVKPADIFERETVKAKGVRVRSKSFVFPNVEIGSIIEYRWKEIRKNNLTNYVRLEFAREIPVEYVKYSIKPANIPVYGMRLHSLNTSGQFTKDPDGFYSSTMENVPSFRPEPFMPSEYEVRPWVLAYYEDDFSKTPEEYWQNLGKKTFSYHKSWLEANDDIRQASRRAIGDATDKLEQARRIFDFCRSTIVNVDDDITKMTPEKLKNVKPNKNVSDVLKNQTGTWHDIHMLFGAMLNAADIDGRVANVPARTDAHFRSNLGNGYFNRTEIVAAKINNEWKFFDPSNRYISFGSLFWSLEDQSALISDPAKPFFVSTPVSTPELSAQKRSAILRLNEDGSIEGDVRIEYTGHLGRLFKESSDTSSPAEREKAFVARMKQQTQELAEITAISIENATDTLKPLTYVFHIKFPTYAEKTGKRLFFVPNIFERGSNSKFVRSNRRYDLSFDYAWTEQDDITVELPKGYAPESLTAPPDMTDSAQNASLEIKLTAINDRTSIRYVRDFTFGKKGALEFNNIEYPAIKQLFDRFHAAETAGVMLSKETK